MNDALAAAIDAALGHAAAAGRLVRPPVDAAMQEQAVSQAGRPIPDELRIVYARANGAELISADLLDIADFITFNELPGRFVELPGAVIVGSDRGDGVFLLDPQGALGHGTDTVYMADLGLMVADLCRVAETNFALFIEAALAGRSFRDAPTLAKQSLQQLFAAIDAHPGRVELRSALPIFERIGPEYKTASRAPLLGEFYDRYNGLAIPRAGVEIGGMGDVAAVVSSLDATGRPGCLHVGQVAGLEAYVSTGGGWRGLPADRLLLAPNDAELDSAAPLGRFPDVLRTFILAEEAA